MRASPLFALLVTTLMASVLADASLGGPSTSFVARPSSSHPGIFVRGGATAKDEAIEFESSDEDIEEEESESEEEEEEEEEEDLDPKLAKSTQVKAATIKTKVAKAAVKAAIAPKKKKKKKKSGSLLKFLHIPYIIKACLNPFTFLKMTRAYWASLVQLKYLEENTDSSQDLRSALEQKAKKGGGPSRGKRKFKPGQAKTLSDLPQLST